MPEADNMPEGHVWLGAGMSRWCPCRYCLEADSSVGSDIGAVLYQNCLSHDLVELSLNPDWWTDWGARCLVRFPESALHSMRPGLGGRRWH